MSELHSEKAGEAFDRCDTLAFCKHVDQSILHKLKAGEDVPQVTYPEKFMSYISSKSHNDI